MTENTTKKGSNENKNRYSCITAYGIAKEHRMPNITIQFAKICFFSWSNGRNENRIPNGNRIMMNINEIRKIITIPLGLIHHRIPARTNEIRTRLESFTKIKYNDKIITRLYNGSA